MCIHILHSRVCSLLLWYLHVVLVLQNLDKLVANQIGSQHVDPCDKYFYPRYLPSNSKLVIPRMRVPSTRKSVGNSPYAGTIASNSNSPYPRSL